MIAFADRAAFAAAAADLPAPSASAIAAAQARQAAAGARGRGGPQRDGDVRASRGGNGPVSARVVHLLRHGPPIRQGLLLGHTDEPACHPDCPRMRDRTRHLAVERVVSSDLARAAHQAEHLAQALDVPLRCDGKWRELNFGAWDGAAPESLDPAALACFWDDPEGHAPPGGERWSDLRARISAALHELEPHSLVVTHAGAMRAALSVLTDLDHRGVWALDLPYRALLSLRIWPGLSVSGQVIGLVTDAAP